MYVVFGCSRDASVQKIENGEGEWFFLLLQLAPAGVLRCNKVSEERMQANGCAGRTLALLDVPDEGSNTLDCLCVIAQQSFEVMLGHSLVGEPANKMIGSRLSSDIIAIVDTTSVRSTQSSGCGGR
jgi:hypothetical protein